MAAWLAALASAPWPAALPACFYPCLAKDWWGTCVCADNGNAAALSSALLVCMVVPWALCLLFFTGSLLQW